MVRAGEFVDKSTTGELFPVSKERSSKIGLVRDLNPGPLAPKARIIPLDQRAAVLSGSLHSVHPSALNRLQDEPAVSFLFFLLSCCLISTPSFSIPTCEFWAYPLLFSIHVPDNSRLRMGSEEIAFQISSHTPVFPGARSERGWRCPLRVELSLRLAKYVFCRLEATAACSHKPCRRPARPEENRRESCRPSQEQELRFQSHFLCLKCFTHLNFILFLLISASRQMPHKYLNE